MYKSANSNEDKVTLTKSQLQAILELITQMGGMKSSETNNEVTTNANNFDRYVVNSNESNENKSDSRIGRELKRDQSLYGSQGSLVEKKRMQWNQEREDSVKSDGWFQKFESDEYSRVQRSANNSVSGRYSPFSVESTSVPTTPSNSSGNTCLFPYPPPSTFANSYFEGRSFRRYSRNDMDPVALEEKRLKAIEYQRALQQQKEEKEKRLREERLKQKQEEELIEKRFREQQQRLKFDYEEEQRKILEKQVSAEKKRLAVVAAIQRTPSVKKSARRVNENQSIRMSNDNIVISNEIQQESNNFTTQRKDTAIQTENDNSFKSQEYRKTIGTQTDYHLIYRWFNEIKPKSGYKHRKRFTPELNGRNSAPEENRSSTPRPKSGFKSLQNDMNKNEEIRSNKSQFAIKELKSSELFKSTSKKTGNRLKSTESNRLRLQKQLPNCTQKLGEIYAEPSTGDYHLSLSSSSSQEFEVKCNSVNAFRSNSPPIPTLQRRFSEACTSSEKKNICLPSIVDIERPHSRRKWKSQETFNPLSITSNDQYLK